MKNPLVAIFLIVAVDVLGLTIVIPLLPFYAEHYGASPFVAGLVVTTYAVCQLVSGPILGQLSDRLGRRPVLLVSQMGSFIGFLILAFANSLWMVFLARFIDGVTAGNLSIAQAAISDFSKPEDRAKSFALIGISFGLGFLVGPAISAFLSGYGYQYPVLASAALSFISIVATYFLLPEKPAGGIAHGARLSVMNWSAYLKYFKDPRLAPLLFQFLFFAFSFAIFLSGFPLFAERRFWWHDKPYGPREVGYLYALAGFLGVIVQGGFVGRLVKRFGETSLVVASFALSCAGYTLMSGATLLPNLVLAIVIFSFGHAVLRPSITSLVSRSADSSEQGVVLGLTQSLNSFAQILSPMLGGLLIEVGWLTAWALVPAVLSACGCLLAYTRKRRIEEAAGIG